MLIKDVLLRHCDNILFGYLGTNIYSELVPLKDVDIDDDDLWSCIDRQNNNSCYALVPNKKYLLLDIGQERDPDKCTRVEFSDVNYLNDLMNAPEILYGLEVNKGGSLWSHLCVDSDIDVKDYYGRCAVAFEIVGECDPVKRKQIAYQDFKNLFERTRIKADNLEQELNDQTRILNNLNLFFSKYATT